jgi:hypothetical protein
MTSLPSSASTRVKPLLAADRDRLQSSERFEQAGKEARLHEAIARLKGLREQRDEVCAEMRRRLDERIAATG